jgi:DUF4097 and DUF4098 domain-containing protein YvlB
MTNIMKIAGVCLAVLGAGVSFSQNKPEVITVPLSRPGEPVSLEIDILSARIEVIGEDRRDAEFSITMAGGERKIKTPSGTKTLAGGGFGLEVEEEDNSISIDAEARTNKVEIVARIPRRASLDLSTVENGEIVVRNVTGDAELENVSGPINVTNMNGSVIAETVDGPITVGFAAIGAGGGTALSSLNGDIAVMLPANAGVELRIDSAHGEIDSAVELDLKASKPVIERDESREGVSVRVEDIVVATVNGGGPVVRMKTLNGDIKIGKSAK